MPTQTNPIPHLLVPLVMLFASAAGSQSGKPGLAATPVSGVSIHHCSCTVGCPCMFGPQLSECRMVMVHHINRGTMDGHRLDGATVVTVLPSHKDLAVKPAPRFKAAIYVDKTFSRPAQTLLVRLFTPRELRTGKQLLATPASVKFQKTATGYRTEVSGHVVAETKARVGKDGKQLVVHNVNFAEGSTWRVGENVTMTLKDSLGGWTWDLKGRNGTWSVWNWERGKGHQSVEPGRAAGKSDKASSHASCSCCL